MAIGDAVSQIMGTATTNRQPSSGVEEKITSIAKESGTDQAYAYDGSNTLELIKATAITGSLHGDTAAVRFNSLNVSIYITNSVYFRKPGTSDRIHISGIQTNV